MEASQATEFREPLFHLGVVLGNLGDSSEMGLFKLRWYPMSSVTSGDAKGDRSWLASPGFPAFPRFL